MKIGDIVRLKGIPGNRKTGVVISEMRHGINRTWVDVLVDEQVIPVDWKILEVVCESR